MNLLNHFLQNKELIVPFAIIILIGIVAITAAVQLHNMIYEGAL